MTDLFGHGPYSDEALWRARFDNAVAEAWFWRNFALLRPFAVSTRVAVPPRHRPRGVASIPRQRRASHPAVPELAERALRAAAMRRST